MTHDENTALAAIRANVGGCRQWFDAPTSATCNAPADYVLWGKLIPPDGLGPRCYDCAHWYVNAYGLESRSGWALINLRDLARDVTAAEPLHVEREA